MTTAQNMVRDLVHAFPELFEIYDGHVADNGEVLPHVIFGIGGGIADRVVTAYIADDPADLNWRGVLAFLDEQIGLGHKDIVDVIGTDFLFVLPGPGQPGHGIAAALPPGMRSVYDSVRSS